MNLRRRMPAPALRFTDRAGFVVSREALVFPEETDVIEQAYDAACPNCGGPARWAGVRTSVYQRVPSARMWLRDSLAFRVDCPVCS